jgi:hypothetical protein
VDRAVNIESEDLRQTVMDMTGGLGADMVVDATGAQAAIYHMVDIVKKGGRIVAFAAWLRRHGVEYLFGQSNPAGITLACLERGIKQIGYQYYAEFSLGGYADACILGHVGYTKVAESCGCKGIRVEKSEEIAPALDEALAADNCVLIDLICDPASPLAPLSPKVRARRYDAAAKRREPVLDLLRFAPAPRHCDGGSIHGISYTRHRHQAAPSGYRNAPECAKACPAPQ